MATHLGTHAYNSLYFGSDSISMTAASDSSDKADAEHIQIGASLHLALGGLQIVDLASVRRHLACIPPAPTSAPSHAAR